ncbi:MAG: ABC transporter ATP-binding protein [Rhodobacteraceae bacterium]|nr:ABC transporter ATP-binding protein [Paracoccaceae bacterium]
MHNKVKNRISLNGVSYRVNDKTIINNLNLEITEKRIGIVGRNGSGKSSLVRLIGGLIKPSSGKIVVNDIDVYSDRKNAIRTIGMVFQNPDHQIIFPTVLQELAFGLNNIGHTRDEANKFALRILENFGKSHWAERPVSTLSEGQKHLVYRSGQSYGQNIGAIFGSSGSNNSADIT